MRPATPNRTLLHTALQLDAATSGVMGVLLVLAAGTLADPLGLPEPLLRGAGLVLLPFALAVAHAGTRRVVPRQAALAILTVNLLWVVGSAALLVGLAPSPSPLGFAFVVVQALTVLGFAEAQWIGLRRSSRMAAA
jgi:hypothetical protein